MSRPAAIRESRAAPPSKVTIVPREAPARQRRIAASTSAGAAISKHKNRTRRSNGLLWSSPEVGSDSIFLHTSIERPATQSQRFRRMAHIAGRACQRFPDKNRFHRFEAQFVQILTGRPHLAQPKIAVKDARAARHK